MRKHCWSLLILLDLLAVGAAAQQPDAFHLENGSFRVELDRRTGGIMALKRAGDSYDTNFVISRTEHPEFDIEDSRWLGALVLRYREPGGAWQLATTSLSADARTIRQPSKDEIVIEYLRDATNAGGLHGIRVRERYRL